MASTRATTAALTRLSASTPRAASQAQRSFGAWAKTAAAGRRTVLAVPAVGHHRAVRPVGPVVGAFESRRWDSSQAQPPQGEGEGEKKGQEQEAVRPDKQQSKIYDFEDIQNLIAIAIPFAENQSAYLSDGSKPLLIDVRTPSEYAAGAIPSAVNVPVTSAPDAFFATDEDWEDRFGFPKPDARREVVFYCKAGVRSRAAAMLARQAGYVNVGEYPGSWLDWERQVGKE
ncbi:Rhodanese-like domain-containing protein [Phyllosticta citribraziliensis]|uniref:Rhodanese-like domain-containing protein n=1 Tax=Phyllosticta citribraziliensis TaxID=989973 RepID=A0ABR1LY01_9PEZI